MGLAGAVGSINTTAKSTAFDRVDTMCSAVSTLIARIEVLADRLVGPTPQAGNESPQNQIPTLPGLIGGLDANVEFLQGRLPVAYEALSRIERALP